MTKAFSTRSVLVLAAWVFTQAVQAEIIYSGADQNIVFDQSKPSEKISIAGSDARWDDLAIILKVRDNPNKQSTDATVHPTGNGRLLQTAGIGDLASWYAADSIINDSSSYTIRPMRFFSHANRYVHESGSGNDEGHFRNATGFIGLQLSDAGNTYFGWAQVTTENYDNAFARLTVHDWAYNSTPSARIYAGQTTDTIPEPNSIAMFMACAGCIFSFRRIFMI